MNIEQKYIRQLIVPGYMRIDQRPGDTTLYSESAPGRLLFVVIGASTYSRPGGNRLAINMVCRFRKETLHDANRAISAHTM